ncbi:MAG: beta-ketoacyl-ACP synthase II [Phycicoccus sp.]|uniref:beta-ketoacyl-ACP synthase II n=1 Tax=Phycicoccus sp. TaxID=1902410 RepID=UPI0025852D2A|nr:beta-ketoacyl-ACP synthase II [Phycicoccus sp.]MCO5303644.1 beta-ketoacyl-ACP synthase II [Phycicoccus sp.]
MSSARRVVITGLGATTPLGGSFADTWDGLLAGRSGMRTMDFPWVEEFEMPAKFAALLHTSPEEVLSKVECRRMDPSTQYAMVAAKDAWADTGAPDVDPIRFGVAIGTGMGGLHTLLGQWDILREKGVRRVFPLAVPMLMPNSPSGTVSLNFGARAGAHTTVSACASGAESMGTAYEMIRAGRADIAIAGGTEAAIHPICFAGFCQMQALSTRNDDPTHASRPYDTSRDGFVMGEGAGVLVLESEEHAKARGARIYAEFGGIGMSADAHHITAPEPEGAGASRAMVEAVERAGLTPADIIHVNAHATSTPVGDVAEANAIRRAFGDAADGMAVSGTKSMTGHLLGAAGALEGVITAKSIAERIAPPTINIVDFDPAISLDVVRDTPRDLPAGDIAALNNSFGFGGHNVALVIKSY